MLANRGISCPALTLRVSLCNMITALIHKSANLLPSRGHSDWPEGSCIVYGEKYESGVEDRCIMIHQCLARANCRAPNAGSDITLVKKAQRMHHGGAEKCGNAFSTIDFS